MKRRRSGGDKVKEREEKKEKKEVIESEAGALCLERYINEERKKRSGEGVKQEVKKMEGKKERRRWKGRKKGTCSVS